MKLECRDNELAEFSLVYAIPVGGKRHFRFKSSQDMAEHITQNRPGLFEGVPYLGEKYDETMDKHRTRGYRLPQKD